MMKSYSKTVQSYTIYVNSFNSTEVKLLLIKVKSLHNASSHLKEIVRTFDPQGNQNDAHEFLTFLLDKLNEEASKMNFNIKLSNKVIRKEVDTNADEGEWEEVLYFLNKVKKGGKRMKLENNLKEFKLTLIGDVFQGIMKIETETKG